MNERPKSIEDYYVTVRHFAQGLHQPPIEDSFFDVLDWNVTADNTLIVAGKTYKFVSPPGMWQSVHAKLKS